MRAAAGPSLLVLAACGTFVPVDGSEPASASGPVTTTTGAPVVDAGAAPVVTPAVRRCDARAPFGPLAPVAMPSLGTRVDTVRLGRDGVGILSFDDDADDAHELRSFQLVGDRIVGIASLGSAYEKASLGQAAPTSDGRTLVLTRMGGERSSDLLFARRDRIDQPFPAPRPVLHAGIGDALFDPHLVGTNLYVSRDPQRGGAGTVMVGAFDPATGVLTGAKDIPALAVLPGREWIPVVTADELEIFFAHSLGDDDATVMHASRKSTSEEFGAPGFVVSLPSGSIGFDYPSSVSNDACTLLVLGDRRDARSVLMRATRP